MNPLYFIILCLATHRLALMLTKETGPAKIFERLRRFVKRETPKDSSLKEGISCPWCVSVWFGVLLAVGATFFTFNPIFEMIVLALALSDAAVIINQAFTRDDK